MESTYEWRPVMNDPLDKDEDLEHAPIGAILITTLLAVVIVTLWVGIYILNLVRS
jgi:cytochrome b